MLINTVTQMTPRARSLQTQASASNVFGPVGASSSRLARHHQGTRAYCWGMWSSYFDPDYRRDNRRRQRMLKYRHAETLNRRLRWHQHPLAENSKDALGRMAGRCWFPAKDFCGSRMINMDDRKQEGREDTSSETRNSSGQTRITSSSGFWSEYDTWRSQLSQVINQWTKQPSPNIKKTYSQSSPSTPRSNVKGGSKYQEDVTTKTSPSEEEYVFDPISNRKVLKAYDSTDNSSDISVDASKSCRFQFKTFLPPKIEDQERPPVHSNGPPPAAELKMYGQVEIDPLPSENSKCSATDYHLYNPELRNEEYALNHLPPEEPEENYGANKHIESDLTTENPTQQCEDLNKYKSHRYNDPGEHETVPSPAYDDLHKYRPTTFDETPVVDESKPKYEDLDKYRTYVHQEDIVVEDPLPRDIYLNKYQPSRYQEQIAPSTSAPKYEDLDKYNPETYNDVQDMSHSTSKYEDLEKYKPKEFDETKPAEYDTPFQQYGDLDSYKAFRYQESDGISASERDIIAEGLKDFDKKNDTRAILGEFMEDHIKASDAVDRPAIESVHISRMLASGGSDGSNESGTPVMTSDSVRQFREIFAQGQNRPMTGSFVSDFPEEFAKLWKTNPSAVDEGLKLKVEEDGLETAYEQDIQNTEKEHSDHMTRSTNLSRLEPAFYRSKLETALNRNNKSMSRLERKVAEVDPYSKEAQGLETCYSEECGSKPAYAKTYGSPENTNTQKTVTDNEASPPEAATVKKNFNEEPTVYKILAYDPTMQNVSIAETTSIVPDQASPLTPTEVLLRLSNPSKFFPHFAPLQAQGFEIVSGSGDVLVFRKVRAAARANPASTNSSPVNPIDMMGRKPTALPNASAFASPTGFVNYNDPPPEQTQAPPFRSNIDVRREEPVFSGPQFAPKGEGKRRKSVTKRMFVGGVSVVGISYALGVVAEYFSTGGIDGKGPKSF